MALIAMLLSGASALAAPGTIPLRGDLTDSGGDAINGMVSMHFGLYGSRLSERVLYEEAQEVNVDEGRFAVELGLGPGFSLPALSAEAELWVQVTVEEDEPMRFPLGSSVFARLATYAESAGTVGGVAAEELFSATLGGGLEKQGSGFGLLSTCSDGQILAFVDGEWVCANDANTQVRAGDGLSISSGVVEFLPGCAAGEIAFYNPEGGWACGTDQLRSAGDGLRVSESGLALITCEAGEQLTSDGTNWGCTEDALGIYSAGDGLALVGTEFQFLPGCGGGQIPTFDSGLGWVCGLDRIGEDSFAYVAGDGLELAVSTFSLPSTCSAFEFLRFDGMSWGCAAEPVAGDGLDLDGGTFSLLQGCNEGAVPVFDGSSWGCGVRIGEGSVTDTSIGSGAAIAATKVGSGSVDNTELGYVDGVTSAIQSQLDAKQDTSTSI